MTGQSRIPQTHRAILVRHARSDAGPSRPSTEWGLSTDGHAAAERLAALALFDHAAGFYAGPERRMAQTLAPAAAERGPNVTVEPAFSESHAQGWLEGDAFHAAIQRYFESPASPASPGWEPAEQAAERFAAGIHRLCAVHAPVVAPGHVLPGTFAVCSGGRAITAYLARTLGWSPAEALASWQGLLMPDLAVLELPAAGTPSLVIPFGTLRV